MSEWVDLAVYVSFIVAVWGWMPAWGSRFTAVALLLDRNPEWVAAHPQEVARFADGRWFIRICRGWAAFGVLVLLALQLDLWSPTALAGPRWEALKDASGILLIVGGAFLLICGMLAGRWIETTVPRAAQRQATLERRRLADFVPLWARLAVATVVAAHVIAWITVGLTQQYSTPAFWGRLAINLMMPAIVFFLAMVGVNRRPGALDRILGPAYRRFEVRYAFGLLLIPPVAGAVRLYEEVAATELTATNRLMHLAIPLLVAMWVFWFGRAARHLAGVAPPPRRPGPRVAGIVATFCLAAAVVHGQDLTGAWQGTVQAGQPLRIVFTIVNAEGGPRTTLHSIDQGASMAATGPVVQGTAVRMTVTAIDGTFEGRLSADGTAMIGTWTARGSGQPLTLTRATPSTAWAIPAPPTPMAADAPAVFELATIRPSNPDATGKLFTVKGRQVLTINTTVADLISFAHGVHPRQIIDGPPWIHTERFDVTGQPVAPGIPGERQLKAMIERLLTDRFKLGFTREARPLPVYALSAAAGGATVTRNDGNPGGLPNMLFRRLGELPVVNATMAEFAALMQYAVLDRPVVDRTGLPGRYDFTLTWTPDESQFAALGVRVPPPSGDPNAPPGLFTAIQEQAGLRFEPTTAPVTVLVIDAVQKPGEN